MSKKPVILYGASGYTARLIAEFLREYQIPFIAAGRNAEKIKGQMDIVPGIETADYEIVQVDHTEEALTELFSGAKVVCATVGPFARLGTTVVQAALNAGIHYIDTTAEQEWMIDMKTRFSDAFAEKNIVLAPSCSYMHANTQILCEMVLEEPSVDTLEAACIPTGVPTVASTRSVMDLVRIKQRWLKDGELYELESPMTMRSEVVVPGMASTNLALPWGASGLPLWYSEDARVRNLTSVTGFTNRPLMEGVVQIAEKFQKEMLHLSNEEQEAALNEIADGITPGMPPRENRNIHRTIDMVYGKGNLKMVKATMIGNSAYLQTGLIQAFVADKLVRGKPNKVGFASPCEVVNYKEMLGALESYGFAKVHIEKTGC